MWIEAIVLGLVAGVLVGLMGIGGGVVLVPAMVYFMGFDQKLAQGTSLFLLLPPTGLGALIQYWKRGRVDLTAGIVCAAGFLAGGFGGSWVALGMSSRSLRGVFGGVLIFAAVMLWRRANRASQAEKSNA